MPRTRNEEASEQVNLKLAAARHEVLRAAAFVQGAPNLREVLMPVVDRLIDELQEDEAVKLALRARRLAQDRPDAVVAKLRPRDAAGD